MALLMAFLFALGFVSSGELIMSEMAFSVLMVFKERKTPTESS